MLRTPLRHHASVFEDGMAAVYAVFQRIDVYQDEDNDLQV
jgi:hypothetical protein